MTNTFDIQIKKEDGSVGRTIKIKRVVRSKLKDLVMLQQDLISEMVKSIDMKQMTVSMGELLADDNVWDKVTQVAKMFNVVGDEKFDVNEIEEDWQQIGQIFFSESCDGDGVIRTTDEGLFAPSRIATLHQLNYFNKLVELILEFQSNLKNRFPQMIEAVQAKQTEAKQAEASVT